MVKKNIGDLVGGWAFLIGVILAVVVGFFPTVQTPTVVLALVVIGILVGILNVADREVTPFLLSGLTLVLVAKFGGDALSSIGWLSRILGALMTVFVPATVIVAVKNVLTLAKR